MKKIVILIFLLNAIVLSAEDKKTTYFDKSPTSITKGDLKIIRVFDRLAYEIAEYEPPRPLKIEIIVEFILKNKSIVHDYSKITAHLVGSFGRRTKRTGSTEGDYEEGTDSDSFFPDEFNYYRAGVAVKYPLYDEKMTKEIKNKKIEYKAKIITMVEKFAKSNETYKILSHELKYLRLNQIRDKAMQKTAQKYLDERLKTIKAIMDTRNKMSEARISRDSMKLQLLNLVLKASQKELPKLLKG